MAKLFEYQAKSILQRFKIPVPDGQVVCSLVEAREVARQIGYPVVVKAQIPTGKRGKAGGIRIAGDETELAAAVSDVLNSRIHSLTVDTLLVERKGEVLREVYVAITADPRARAPVMIACMDGGVDIEETAQSNPAALLTWHVDILRGVTVYDALNLLRSVADLDSREKLALARVLCDLYGMYRAHDCKLVEINPLALTSAGWVALDARVDIDGDAIGRQEGLGIEMAEEAGGRSATLLEHIAGTIDLGDHRGTVHFVQIDPDLTYIREHHLIPFGFDCVGAGASLTMMDELVPRGFYPVNFCDSSGNPVGSKLYRITKVIFSQPGIEGYVFASCVSSQQLDNTARGIIKALKDLYPETGGQPNIPCVLAFRGAWDEEAIQLLADHGISDGRWVRVLGRDVPEEQVATVFCSLYEAWKAERGDTA